MCADLLPAVYSIMEPQQQQLMVNNRKYQADGGEAGGGQGHGDVQCWADINTGACLHAVQMLCARASICVDGVPKY